MKISIVGAGRVAQNLAIALVKGGHEVVSVRDRTIARAEKLAALLRETAGVMVAVSDDLREVEECVECAIFSIADDALNGVIGDFRAGRDLLCLHTAGSVNMNVWEGCTEHCGVLYPLQTFSEVGEAGAVDFGKLPLFVEASGSGELEKVERLARSLSSEVFKLSSEERRWLHVSAVFGCNFVNALYGAAEDCLKSIGLPLSVLYGLIDETAAKVHRMGPREAQTGPAVRGDTRVMEGQMRLLEGKPELREVYELLSRRIRNEMLRTR